MSSPNIALMPAYLPLLTSPDSYVSNNLSQSRKGFNPNCKAPSIPLLIYFFN